MHYQNEVQLTQNFAVLSLC